MNFFGKKKNNNKNRSLDRKIRNDFYNNLLLVQLEPAEKNW